MGQVNPAANLSVLSSVWFEPTKVRQGEDYRVALNTGIENTDRYLAFTNYAVMNSAANAPDVVATGVVNLFLPKGASEVPVYDLDGNLTSDGRWTYAWDALNRLKSVESKTDAPAASKHRLVFTYDAGGRRIKKEEFTWNTTTSAYQASTTLKFLYDGWNMVAELDGSSAPLRTYGWLGKGGGLLWMKDHASGQFHVPGYDGNGNITRLIKYSDKTVSAEYEYGPYGGLLRATGPMAQAMPFRFSSEYQDDVTGLVYYGHRYYSPQTRRWLSKDPIGLAGGLNLYGFVGNDPINNWDLLGLQSAAECWEPPAKSMEEFRARADSQAKALKTFSELPATAFQGVGSGLNYIADHTENSWLGGYAAFGGSIWNTAGGMVSPSAWHDGIADFSGRVGSLDGTYGHGMAVNYALTSWNWGEIYSGANNIDYYSGEPVGDFYQRATRVSNGVGGFASAGAVGLKLIPSGKPSASPKGPTDPKPAAPPEVKCPPGDKKPLHRPSLRKGLRDEVDSTGRTPDGKWVDANTGEIFEGDKHYGHVYGHESRRILAEAEAKGLTQAELNDLVNSHPEWFQIEYPPNNLGHKFEKPGGGKHGGDSQ